MDDYSKKIHENQSNGDKVRAIRKRKGMTIKSLAESCMVSSKTIQHYENGERHVNNEMLNLIAEKLQVNPAALYEYPFESISDVMHILFDLERSGLITLAECEPNQDCGTQAAQVNIQITNEILQVAVNAWYRMQEHWKTHRLSDADYHNWQDAFPSVGNDSAVKSGLRSNTMTEDDWAKIKSLTSDAFDSCPFCGEKKASLQMDITHKRLNPAMNNDKYASPFFVECGVCSARGGFDLDPYEAIKKWNNR